MIIDSLMNSIIEKDAPIVVGLDPSPNLIPIDLINDAKTKFSNKELIIEDVLFNFNKILIDELHQLIPAVKPQIAMYEQFGIGGLLAYEKTIFYAHEKSLIVIEDVKRGDIGNTSKAYANAHLGETVLDDMVFKGTGGDFMTINPYFGEDGIRPFIDTCKEYDKGLFILVKTSNKSSSDFQDLICNGEEVYSYVAKHTKRFADELMGEEFSNIGAVVGATHPNEAVKLRKLMPNVLILVPGYGAQGAKGSDLAAFFNDNKRGAIINSSRGIIGAYKQEKYNGMDFSKAALQATKDMIIDIKKGI